MSSKGEVIKAHGRLLGHWMAGGILLANHWGVEKGRCVRCVADKTEDIDGREINSKTGG